jgi:hypothetical protein
MAFPATYNISYYRGDSYDFIINPKNPNGTAFNLTNYSALFTIASSVSASAVNVAAMGEAAVSASAGTVTCSIPPEIGQNLSAGPYTYDIQIFNSSSSATITLLRGEIALTQDVTR